MPRAAGQLLKFHPTSGLDRLPRRRAGLAIVPLRARLVSSSSSIQPVGWTICLGRRGGLAIVRDAGPGSARQVSSSSSIQPVGWTVCLG